jgi:predicted dehydrogenase
VYCEKPFTPASDDGYELAERARRRDVVLTVGFQFRFHKGYAALRDAVTRITPVRRVNLTATNWFRAQQYFRASPWRATWRMAGGGVLMGQAVHQIDALIAGVGMPSRVRGEVRASLHDTEVEDDAIADLEWSDGAQGRIVASLNEPAGVERFEIVGERGAVVLTDGYDVRVAGHDVLASLVDECPDEFPSKPPEWETVEVPRAKSEWFDMLVDALNDFAGAIDGARTPRVGGVTGSNAVELANAIYLSSVRREPVDLPLTAGVYPPVFEELASGRTLLRS